ncbi:MAG: hypothetical protein IMZ43_09620 [Thermoplasmata archaeon]|nr:hypothetical protein [Thermoplasmata archaeon]
MGLVDPIFEFGFDVLDKGVYGFEVKETGIEPPKADKTSGKRYWVRLIAMGGSQDGTSHMESFFEITKDDFSFRKMAGLLYKLGVIKSLGKIDTAFFLTSDFEQKWLRGINGKKMGGKIKHRFDKDDRDHQNPRSDLEKYMTYDEAMTIINKGSPPVVGATTAPPAPAEKAPWD